MKKYRLLCAALAAAMVLGLLSGCTGGSDYSSVTLPQVTTKPQETEAPNADPTETVPDVGTPDAEGTQPSDPDTVPDDTTAPSEPQVDYEEVYGEVLSYFLWLLESDGDMDGLLPGSIGVTEAMIGFQEDAKSHIGYAIEDISGDGIPELLIGSMADSQEGSREILALYNCVNGHPAATFEGWARSAFLALTDSRFAYFGSGGAAYTTAGLYALNEAGTELECLDYYFTQPNEENYELLEVYNNKVGSQFVEDSEQLDWGYDELWAAEDAWLLDSFYYPMTPFSSYTVRSQAAEPAKAELPVKVKLGSEIEDWSFDFDTFYIDYDTEILFYPEGQVTDFTILELTLEDVSEDGAVSFATRPLFTWDTLSSDRPVLLGLHFMGLIPGYGVSFTDETGTTHTCAIDISGMDGSVYLWEF